MVCAYKYKYETRKWLVCVYNLPLKSSLVRCTTIIPNLFSFLFTLLPSYLIRRLSPSTAATTGVETCDDHEHHENVCVRLFMCLLHAYRAFNVNVCVCVCGNKEARTSTEIGKKVEEEEKRDVRTNELMKYDIKMDI